MTGAIIAFDVVMERSAFAQRDPHHRSLSLFGCFSYSFRNLASFTSPMPNSPSTISYNNKRCKTKSSASLDDFSYSVYTNQLLDQFGIFFLFPIISILPICSCNLRFPLKFMTGPACSFSESLYTTVVTISPSIKDNVIESFFESPFCYKFSNRFSC